MIENRPPEEPFQRKNHAEGAEFEVPGPEALEDSIYLSEVEMLLRRMRSGDREAAAVFIVRYESRLRRRIRGKLNPSMRRVFDSQDILSTISRRLDQFVRSGRLEASSEQQLWALIFRMANNAIIDKSRVYRRLQQTEGPDSSFAQDLLMRLRQAERQSREGVEIELEKALKVLTNSLDKEILSLWLMGTRHREIAQTVGMAPAAVRKRWQKIKEKLQLRFLQGSQA